MNQPTPAHRSLTPYWNYVEGSDSGRYSDTPNCATVEAVTGDAPQHVNHGADDGWPYADRNGTRGLVKVDTNYKPTSRIGAYPVCLTREDAVQFASEVLEATEDTFHLARRGQLRPEEAGELLRALEGVDTVLAQLREHALGDLLDNTVHASSSDELDDEDDEDDDPDE